MARYHFDDRNGLFDQRIARRSTCSPRLSHLPFRAEVVNTAALRSQVLMVKSVTGDPPRKKPQFSGRGDLGRLENAISNLYLNLIVLKCSCVIFHRTVNSSTFFLFANQFGAFGNRPKFPIFASGRRLHSMVNRGRWSRFVRR